MTAATPRILAVAYGGGHIAMMLPVLHALRARLPGTHIDLMALTTARRAAVQAGEHPLGYADFLHLVDAGAALAHGRRLAPDNTHPDVPEAETLAYLGINWLDWEARHGATQAARLWAESGRRAFYPLDFFRRVVAQLRPALVLATNAPRSEQAAVDAAAEQGIPTLAILDLFGLPGDAFAARTRHPDRVCVLAEAVRDNLVRAGWPADRIAITGNPAFDALHDPAVREQAAAFRARLGWQDKKVVLLAAHPEPRSHPATSWPPGNALPEAMERTLRDWVRTRSDAALVVRHHPNHWHLFPRLPDTPQVHFSEPGVEAIDPLILAADCVVVQTTTVGLQAATVGIPVLALQSSPGALSAFSFADLGVAQGVRDVPDLPAAVNAALDHPPPPTPWARHARAADAVADEAVALLQRRHGVLAAPPINRADEPRCDTTCRP